MNSILLTISTLAFLVAVAFLIPALIELRKASRSLNIFLDKTTDSLIPTLNELEQTLSKLKDISGNLNKTAEDIKTFSGAVNDVGQSIKHISRMFDEATTSTVVKVSGLRAGIRTAMEVLLHNLFKTK